MISGIRLANFKCFQQLRLELAPLTLLTGFNAAGKSTTIQTLLLLAQTLRGQRGPAILRLNGPLVALGTAGDVINSRTGVSGLELGLTSEGVELDWEFAVAANRQCVVEQLWVTIDGDQINIHPDNLDVIRPSLVEASGALSALDRLIFLSAGRQVETDVFPTPQDTGIPPGDVGPIGQFAAWWLYQNGDSDVPADRRCKADAINSTLRHEVNAWVSDLFPGAEVNAIPVPRTNLMRLELRSGPTSDWSRPVNIGFGISYAFPLLVAGLCAEAGQTLVVDSPEAHLHPRGQSRIGCFLAQMAAAGVQMVAETHSDHVLNGIRIALQNGLIAPEQVAIYFFSADPDSPVTRLSVDKNGTVSDWPEGFFDQSERDLASLAGWV